MKYTIRDVVICWGEMVVIPDNAIGIKIERISEATVGQIEYHIYWLEPQIKVQN